MYEEAHIASEIYCTFHLDLEQVKLLNELEGIKIQGYARSSTKNGRLRILLRLFFFSALNFFKWKQVYIFHEISPVILFHRFFESLNLIEHGEINYININTSPYYERSFYGFFKSKVLKNNYVGESDFFDYVYLGEMRRCPVGLAKKAKPLCLDRLGKKLNQQEIVTVNRIFYFDEFHLGKRNYLPNLLLTQPFSELSMMSESDKVRLYQKAIAGLDGRIVIKPHPKETTDYSLYFPEAEIITGNFPIELFSVNQIAFDKVLTVNSSGAKNTRNREIVMIKDELINGRV